MNMAEWPDGPIWLIGCGTMGGAMLRRWLAAGLAPGQVTVITRSGTGVPDEVRSLRSPPPDETPAVLLLAVKPQQLSTVVPMVAALRPAVLVSILAGVEVATLAALVPDAAVVRAMPNLPVAIGQGVTAVHAVAGERERAMVAALMTPLGLVEWIDDEARFDAVTALAGCGPAFLFRFVDALAGGGAALGIPRDQAMRLALATVEGAATMAAQSSDPPGLLADRVASPGGSTREGLNVLDRASALERLLVETLKAASDRNAELAAAARQ